MGFKWKTVAAGIRYREHATRKHGVTLDRFWALRYRFGGKQREEALGWASQGWTLDRAKEELALLKRAQRTGEGVATLQEKRDGAEKAKLAQAEDEARRARLEKTVADLWDRYSKEVMAVENKPRTIASKTRMWTRRIEPAIGKLKINEATEEDVGAVVRAPLKLDKAGQVIGGKAEGGNIYRLLHHMFRKALGWGLRRKELGNPLETVSEPKVSRRERLLAGGEIGALLKALDKTRVEKKEPDQVVDAIRAAILTGARISEILALRLEYIRKDEMELHLPDTKSGFSRRPMSEETLTLLEGRGKVPGSPYVFRGIKNPKKALAYSTVEKAFAGIAAAAEVPNCTLHTIRHWYATMTANSVSNPRVGMMATGHKSHTAYMNYVHGDKAQARALADQLSALATGLGKAEPNVTKMAERKKA